MSIYKKLALLTETGVSFWFTLDKTNSRSCRLDIREKSFCNLIRIGFNKLHFTVQNCSLDKFFILWTLLNDFTQIRCCWRIYIKGINNFCTRIYGVHIILEQKGWEKRTRTQLCSQPLNFVTARKAYKKGLYAYNSLQNHQHEWAAFIKSCLDL